MKVLIAFVFRQPSEQLLHQPGCVERRSRLENHADLCAVGTDRHYMIRQAFPLAAVTLVLRAVAQKIPVELLDDVPGRSKKDSGVFASPSDQQKSWYKLKPSSSKTYNIKDETSSKCLCPKCSFLFQSTCSKMIS